MPYIIYIYVYMHHQLTNFVWYLDAFENGGLTMIYPSYFFKPNKTGNVIVKSNIINMI